MEVIEYFREAKTGEINDCEDNYFINDNYAAVIDGATNVSGIKFGNLTPGKLASNMIVESLERLKGKENIEEIILEINETYKETYKKLEINSAFEEAYMRPSAAMIVYSKYHHKVWMIGDCQCYFSGENYQNIKHIDQVFEKARSIFVQSELMKGITVQSLQENDTSEAFIRPFIQKQYSFQNTSSEHELSYGVVNGHPIPIELIVEIDVPNDVDAISMASDGYPKIYDNLSETETELKRLNHVDPLCIRENLGIKAVKVNQKSFDDRTYLKFNI